MVTPHTYHTPRPTPAALGEYGRGVAKQAQRAAAEEERVSRLVDASVPALLTNDLARAIVTSKRCFHRCLLPQKARQAYPYPYPYPAAAVWRGKSMTSFADASRDWFTRGGGTGKTVVFSCYFSKKMDPQRGGYLLSNKYAHPHLAQPGIRCGPC
jgi:hypothetical protein